MDLIEQEADNFGLVNVAMVRIHLHQRLNQRHALISHPLAINRLKHFDEVIPIDHRLIDLLIIFLQFGEHLVYFLTDSLLKALNGHRVDDQQQLLGELRVLVHQLRHLYLPLVRLWRLWLGLSGGVRRSGFGSRRRNVLLISLFGGRFLLLLLLLLVVVIY